MKSLMTRTSFPFSLHITLATFTGPSSLQQRGTKLVHKCYMWKLTAGRNWYSDPKQHGTQMIHSCYLNSDRGTQLVNPVSLSSFSEVRAVCHLQNNTILSVQNDSPHDRQFKQQHSATDCSVLHTRYQ